MEEKTVVKSEIRSDLKELVRFRESLLMKDFRRELMRWRRDLISLYPLADSMLAKGRIDGSLEAIVYIMGLVDEMIRVKKEEMEDGVRRNKADG